MWFYAAADSPVPCFFQCKAKLKQVVDRRIVIVEGRVSARISCRFDGQSEGLFINISMITEGDTWFVRL